MTSNFARLALTLAVFGALPLCAAELRVTTQFRTGNVTSFLPILVIRDVGGDSRPEILSCADGHAFALSYDGANYRDVWYSPAVGCWAMTVGDRGNGAQTVFVGTSGAYTGSGGPGYLYAFDPTSYGPELAKVQVSDTERINDVAVGNADADPAPEVVAATATHTYIYDAATLALKWSAPYGGTKVAIADLDGDGVPEIIISGDDGHVLNGVTHAYEWGYDGGFGTAMVLADVDNDGKPEIVGSRRYQSGVLIVDGDTLTARMLPYSFWAESIAVGDANNDGRPELILGRDQSYGIEAYDFNTTKLWGIYSSWYGEQAVAVGDVDGDGKNDLVWASGAGASPYEIYVADAGGPAIKYRIGSFGGFAAVAAGDLDGDGRPELVVTANPAGTGYPADQVRVLDYATHQLLRKGVTNLSTRINQIAIGQVDPDAPREVVVLSDVINIYDGTTLQKKWSGNAPANHLILRDLNGDGYDEILYASSSSVGMRDGATAAVTYPITGLDGPIRDMSLADIDGDAVLDLVVATSSGVYIYKTSDWSRRTYIQIPSTTHVAATAGHFAVSSSYTTNFLTLYSGTSLAQEWGCGVPWVTDLKFVTLAGQSRLAAALSDSTVRFYPLSGPSCPAYDTVSGPFGYGDLSIAFSDVDGDGRPELFVQTYYDATVLSIGWNSEPRGDADADGLVTDADVDALAAYFYGTRLAAPPMADVNGDGAIRPDDLFYLINYRRGTGPAPPQ